MVDRQLWFLIPRQIRSFPADLAFALGLTFLTVLSAVTPVVRQTPLRIALAVPFLFLVPGYVLVATLFPERGGFLTIDSSPTPRASIDGVERLVASLAASIIVEGCIGILLNFTALGVRFVPVVVATTVFVAMMSLAAARRRLLVPDSDRFRVPYRHWIAEARSSLGADSPTGVANVVVVVTILLSVGAVAHTATDGGSGETFSEFYLLTENDEGELVLDDYPENLSNATEPLVVGVRNSEHESTTYTVVVRLQRVSWEGNSPKVVEQRRLRRFRFSLAHGEEWRERHRLNATLAGGGNATAAPRTSVRVQYLLYRGQPPETPRASNAYRELHFWTNATRSAE